MSTGRDLGEVGTQWEERDQGQGEAVGVRSYSVLLLLLLQLGGQEGGGGGDEGVREQDLHQVHPQKL